MPSSISVIIPSYNAESTISRCIESILKTGYTPIEIIIVDDCSTDETSEIVDHLVKKYPETLKQISHEKNSGPATARNTGANIAKGELLFFLDSDTEMLPDCLDRFENGMETADAIIGIYDIEPLNKGAVPLYKSLINFYLFNYSGMIEYEVFDSSKAGIRRTIFEEIGGFNKNLTWKMDFENEELGYRIHENYKMILNPKIKVKHVFPGFKKLTWVYFHRVNLWMKIFLKRRKFESGGTTSSKIGIASASLLLCLSFALLGLGSELTSLNNYSVHLYSISTVFILVYLYGYANFFVFIAKHKPSFLITGILLNIYFTLVIACGASFGLLSFIFSTQEENV